MENNIKSFIDTINYPLSVYKTLNANCAYETIKKHNKICERTLSTTRILNNYKALYEFVNPFKYTNNIINDIIRQNKILNTYFKHKL